MALAQSFRELEVYRRAFEAAVSVRDLSQRFPSHERYALTDQLCRSSRSVCANIAEAWRKRRYVRAFASKLSDADGGAAETIVWLDFALRHGYIDTDIHASLSDTYDHIGAQLNKMMSRAKDWCPDHG